MGVFGLGTGCVGGGGAGFQFARIMTRVNTGMATKKVRRQVVAKDFRHVFRDRLVRRVCVQFVAAIVPRDKPRQAPNSE